MCWAQIKFAKCQIQIFRIKFSKFSKCLFYKAHSVCFDIPYHGLKHTSTVNQYYYQNSTTIHMNRHQTFLCVLESFLERSSKDSLWDLMYLLGPKQARRTLWAVYHDWVQRSRWHRLGSWSKPALSNLVGVGLTTILCVSTTITIAWTSSLWNDTISIPLPQPLSNIFLSLWKFFEAHPKPFFLSSWATK